MKQTGLMAEILFNILFITAIAMFLIGIIAFKVTERFAIQGQIESLKSIIKVYEQTYSRAQKPQSGIQFLKDALKPGAWGVISVSGERILFSTDRNNITGNRSDPMVLQALNSRSPVIEIEGFNLPPFSAYSGIKIAMPLNNGTGTEQAILIYQPLTSLTQNLLLSQRLIALWIILFLIVIALFGFYILSRRVIRPVHELISTTEEIAIGRFPDKKDVGNLREINQLNSALKKMYEEIEHGKKNLTEKITELEETNDELKLTQKELIASEKLASLGKLSAGVAHEIGNPLSAISGYIEVLKRGAGFDVETRGEFISDIQREVHRIDNIIKTLLDYSRPKSFDVKNINVNSVIENSIEILNSQGIMRTTSLNTDLSKELPTINADPHQLSQVVINLVLNAIDAIGEYGEISISTSTPDSRLVNISISDNGRGIDDDITDKIFDPFFTTKEPGKGTGLGLSVSLRIVETFGGKITVESTVGEGTKFNITFPASRNDLNAQSSNN